MILRMSCNSSLFAAERPLVNLVGNGKRAGVPSDTAGKLKALERQVRELGQANEILRKASACSAQADFDRPFKR